MPKRTRNTSTAPRTHRTARQGSVLSRLPVQETMPPRQTFMNRARSCVGGICRSIANRTRRLTNRIGLTRRANQVAKVTPAIQLRAVRTAVNNARTAGELALRVVDSINTSRQADIERSQKAAAVAELAAARAESVAASSIQRHLGNFNRQFQGVQQVQGRINNGLGRITGIVNNNAGVDEYLNQLQREYVLQNPVQMPIPIQAARSIGPPPGPHPPPGPPPGGHFRVLHAPIPIQNPVPRGKRRNN